MEQEALKTCTKCKDLKSVINFSKSKGTPDKLSYVCKLCVSNFSKTYRAANKDKIKAKIMEWRKANLEHSRSTSAKWYQDNKAYKNAKSRQWVKDNSEKARIYHNDFQRVWAKANKDKIAPDVYARKVERMKGDPLFKLRNYLGTNVGNAFRKNGYTKKSRLHELLGADFATVQTHLIQTAKVNYGGGKKHFPNRKYHIDHIIPCSSAKSEAELVALQHYTNLQYLSAKHNIQKSDSLSWTIPSLP